MSPLERFPLIKCVSSPPINYHQPTHWLTDCAKNRVPCWIPRNNIEDTKHGRIHMKPITIIIDIIIGVLSCRSCLFPSFTNCVVSILIIVIIIIIIVANVLLLLCHPSLFFAFFHRTLSTIFTSRINSPWASM